MGTPITTTTSETVATNNRNAPLPTTPPIASSIPAPASVSTSSVIVPPTSVAGSEGSASSNIPLPTREPAKSGGDRLRSTFVEDGAVEEPFRAKLADYINSGYDRGHMVSLIYQSIFGVLTLSQVPAADAKRNQVSSHCP